MSQPTDNNPPPQPNPDVDAPAAETPVDPELDALHSQMLQLQAQGQSGASWFYWVAALSIINSFIAIVGDGRTFLFGLGVTQIVDAFAMSAAADNPEFSVIAKVVAFGFSLVASAVVAGFGWLSNKRITPIFALGMLLYLFDGLLYLLVQEWMSVAFHAFALFSMWQGLIAYRRLSAILRSQPAVA